MSRSRLLIVNADDFGQSRAVNRGIVAAHRDGIVRSASLMVRWPYADEAVAVASAYPGLSLGLHLDLGEWELHEGEWTPLYEVVDLADVAAVEKEIERQFACFEDLVGRRPTHCDSHQHVHTRVGLRKLVAAIGRRRKIPVRHFGAIHYCGAFYGQNEDGSTNPGAISVESLVAILESLSDGVTELACHPADGDDLTTMYRAERLLELQTLCDPRVQVAARNAGVRFASFAELG